MGYPHMNIIVLDKEPPAICEMPKRKKRVKKASNKRYPDDIQASHDDARNRLAYAGAVSLESPFDVDVDVDEDDKSAGILNSETAQQIGEDEFKLILEEELTSFNLANKPKAHVEEILSNL